MATQGTPFERKDEITLDANTHLLGNFKLPRKPSKDQAVYCELVPEPNEACDSAISASKHQLLSFQRLRTKIDSGQPADQLGVRLG
jgi:hypothetical protein